MADTEVTKWYRFKVELSEKGWSRKYYVEAEASDQSIAWAQVNTLVTEGFDMKITPEGSSYSQIRKAKSC